LQPRADNFVGMCVWDCQLGKHAMTTRFLLNLSPRRAAVSVWLTIFLVMAVQYNFFNHTWLDWYRLAHNGEHTVAIVTKIEPAKHATCRFSYVVNGRGYSAEASGCGSDHSVGESIAITYLPRQPSFATPTSPTHTLTTTVALTLLVPTFLSVLTAWGVRRRGRKKDGANTP